MELDASTKMYKMIYPGHLEIYVGRADGAYSVISIMGETIAHTYFGKLKKYRLVLGNAPLNFSKDNFSTS